MIYGVLGILMPVVRHRHARRIQALAAQRRDRLMFALYVTGTDTGIGKTLASCALLHALRGHGLRAAGMKPWRAAASASMPMAQCRCALALQAAGVPGVAYTDINPFALEHPLAPELAARDAGIEVTLCRRSSMPMRGWRRGSMRWWWGRGRLGGTAVGGADAGGPGARAAPAGGAGGRPAPGLPQPCAAQRARSPPMARTSPGWIRSHVDPAMERVDDNLGMLRAQPAPCWGVLPHARRVRIRWRWRGICGFRCWRRGSCFSGAWGTIPAFRWGG